MATSKKFKKSYNSRTLWGKLRVSKMLRSDKTTAGYVPETASFTRKRLKRMAKKHSALYIKPNIGSLGIGIHKLRKTAQGYKLTSVQSKKQKSISFANISSVYRHLLPRQKKGKLIIQQGIKLDHAGRKPYDIRVMVQRKPGNAWTCTGSVARIAPAGRIVTNVHQGAKLHKLSRLWEIKDLDAATAEANSRFIEDSALKISRALSKRYSGMHEMGIDFALDRSSKLWVLEVNTHHPQFRAFKKVDSAMYNRVAEFAQSYGRKDD